MNDKQQLLFCLGIPQAGKKILTAIVVDHLIGKFHGEPSVGVAYVYCNFRRNDDQRLEDLLASLLKQLCEKAGLTRTVTGLCDRHRAKRSRPSADELWRALQAAAASFSRTFIIADALDEYQVSTRYRTGFIDACFDLQARSGSNLFATSRFLPEITEKFHDASKFEIRAHSQDFQSCTVGHMYRVPNFVGQNVSLEKDVKDTVIQAVDGM